MRISIYKILFLFSGLWIALLSDSFAQPAAPPVFQEWLLVVNFNSTLHDDIELFLQDPQGEVWASVQTLYEYHFIKLDQYRAINYQGRWFYRLHDFPGLTYQLDQNYLVLAIDAPPNLLQSQSFIKTQFIPTEVPPPPPGGFLNYDLSVQTYTNANQAGGIFTAGIFNALGVGTAGVLVQDQSPQQNQDDRNFKYIRLNTTWQTDFPMAMKSLRLGDTYTAPSLWSQSVGFGGVQWRTNFGTQPTFVPFPLPSFSGEAVLPSSVDLLVNSSLVGTQKVDPGPFTIFNLPVVTGIGDVTAVTTDLLGRQQVVTAPYYATAQLLKPGLHNSSYETGFVRNHYGEESNNYGPFFIAGTDAFGINDCFTAQWHGELLAQQQTAGVAGSYQMGLLGVFSGAAAMSHADDGGMGELGLVGFQHQSSIGLSFGSNVQVSSPAFVELGYDQHSFPSVQTQSFIGYPITSGSSATLAYTLQANRGFPSASIFTGSYYQSLPWGFNMSLTILTNIGGGTTNQGVFLTLTRALDEYTSTNAGVNAQRDHTQALLQVIRTLPVGTGYGYNILAEPGDNSTYQVGVSAQNDIGTYSLTAIHQDNQNGLRGEVSGAVATIAGEGVYLSRLLNNSFAIVETGVPGATIFNFNQEVATTNKEGVAFVPNLVAYQNNPLSIDPNQLPLNAEIGATKMNVLPYFSSGRLVQFPINMIRSAQMQLVLPSGEPLPAGAEVMLLGNPAVFYVAESGTFYVSGLEPKNTLIATWDGQSCHFHLDLPPTNAILPQLGKVVCEPGILPSTPPH